MKLLNQSIYAFSRYCQTALQMGLPIYIPTHIVREGWFLHLLCNVCYCQTISSLLIRQVGNNSPVLFLEYDGNLAYFHVYWPFVYISYSETLLGREESLIIQFLKKFIQRFFFFYESILAMYNFLENSSFCPNFQMYGYPLFYLVMSFAASVANLLICACFFSSQLTKKPTKLITSARRIIISYNKRPRGKIMT